MGKPIRGVRSNHPPLLLSAKRKNFDVFLGNLGDFGDFQGDFGDYWDWRDYCADLPYFVGNCGDFGDWRDCAKSFLDVFPPNYISKA